MTSPLNATRLARRSIAFSLRSLGVIALISAAVSAIGIIGPLEAGAVLQQDLNYRLSTAGPGIRDLQSATSVVSYDFTGQVNFVPTFDGLQQSLDAIHAKMPPTLRSITGEGRWVAANEGTAGHGIIASGPPDAKPHSSYTYSLEANPELRTDAVLVSGSWPGTVKSDYPETPIPVVTTVATAKGIGWKVGTVQQLAEFGSGFTQDVELVGTVRPRDPSSDFWQLDGARAHDVVTTKPDGSDPVYFGTVWMDADSWPRVTDEFTGGIVHTWFPLTSTSLTVSQIGQLGGDLDRFTAASHVVGTGRASLNLHYLSSLASTILTYRARAGAGNAVMSVVEAGPIGTGIALLLLATLSLVERRRTALRLLRSRGASPTQFRFEVGSQVAAATIPGAIVGTLVALLIAGGATQVLPYLVGAAVAIVPAVVAAFAAETNPVVLTRGGVARPSRWRWVVDALLVLLAGLAIVVLFQRGISGSAGSLTTDPLLVATPLLVSAAACALVLRVMPFVLRRLRTFTRRSRGVIGMVGRANSARAGARFLPVFAILTGVSVSIFAASLFQTEQTGIRDAAVLQVGADISIEAPGIPQSTVTKLRDLPGVAALAAINTPGGVNLVNQPQNISLFAANGRDLAAVQSELPTKYQLFSHLGEISNGHRIAYYGGFAEHVPAVGRFPNSKAQPITTVKVTADPPKFIDDPPWLLIDSASVPKDIHLETDITNILIRVAPGANETVLDRQVTALTGSGYDVQFADTQINALTKAPLVGGLEALTIAAAALSLLLCILSLVLGLVLGAGERALLLARLRALGFSRRQGTGLVGWEVGPMTTLGVVLGAVVGIVLPILFLAVVDLSTFIGSSSRPVLVVDPIFVAIVVVAFAASAVLAVVITAALGARRRQSDVTRGSGEEQ